MLVKAKKTIQETIADGLWRGAQSVRQSTGLATCECDFCKHIVVANLCKVYHTVNKKVSFSKMMTRDMVLMTDHIFICCSCRVLISPAWVSCNCNKVLINRDKEDVCQVNMGAK